MKLSSLANLLSGDLAASNYSAEIADELATHVHALGKGGSAPVAVTEDADLLLDQAGLATLCRLFAAGQLTAHELAYTADALQLADRVDFADPDIADLLSECTDPEINGPLSRSRALEIADHGSAA